MFNRIRDLSHHSMPTTSQKIPPNVDKNRLTGTISKDVHAAPTKRLIVPAHFKYQLRPCDGVTLVIGMVYYLPSLYKSRLR
jgi:hypothetical protein